MSRKSRAKPPSPFRCFNSSPEIIRLAVLMYVRFPLSLRNVEDLLFERGIDISHETVRFRSDSSWGRFRLSLTTLEVSPFPLWNSST